MTTSPTLAADPPVRIAFVGATEADFTDPARATVVRSVAEWDPQWLVLTGGYVESGRSGAWESFEQAWGPLADRALGLPDAATRRGDGRLRRWRDHVGRHANTLPSHATWTHATFVSGDARWRMVLLDTSGKADSALQRDQRTWLPKVVAGSEFDHLLVVLSHPVATLTDTGQVENNAQALLRLVRDHARPVALLAVVSGHTGSNEVLMHAGPYGPLHVNAGNSGGPAVPLRRWGTHPSADIGELALVDDFDQAQQARCLGGDQSDSYQVECAIIGWWQAEITGREIRLGFQQWAEGSFVESYAVRYSRRHGWVAAR